MLFKPHSVFRAGAFTLPAALFYAACPLPFPAAAEEGAWTNQAGHRLCATPIALHGETIEFQLPPPAQTVKYPLSIFPPAEQIRLKQALGIVHIPDELKSAYELAAQNIHRLAILRRKGKISDAEYQADRNRTLQCFRDEAAPCIEQNHLTETQLASIIRQLESL